MSLSIAPPSLSLAGLGTFEGCCVFNGAASGGEALCSIVRHLSLMMRMSSRSFAPRTYYPGALPSSVCLIGFLRESLNCNGMFILFNPLLIFGPNLNVICVVSYSIHLFLHRMSVSQSTYLIYCDLLL